MGKFSLNVPCLDCRVPVPIRTRALKLVRTVRCPSCRERRRRFQEADLFSPASLDAYEVRAFRPELVRENRSTNPGFYYQVRRKGDPYFVTLRVSSRDEEEAARLMRQWHQRAEGRWNVSAAPKHRWFPEDWVRSLEPSFDAIEGTDEFIEHAVHPVHGTKVYWLVGDYAPGDFATASLDMARLARDKMLRDRLERPDPCHLCKRRPVFRGGTLRHIEKDCPVKFRFDRRYEPTETTLSRSCAVLLWNREFAPGLRQHFGSVTLWDLYLMDFRQRSKNPFFTGPIVPNLEPEEKICVYGY